MLGELMVIDGVHKVKIRDVHDKREYEGVINST